MENRRRDTHRRGGAAEDATIIAFAVTTSQPLTSASPSQCNERSPTCWTWRTTWKVSRISGETAKWPPYGSTATTTAKPTATTSTCFSLLSAVIEHLPQELRDRFTEMREMDLSVQSES